MNEPNHTVVLETEWDLLGALWDRQRGTAREVAEDLASTRGWAYSTVKTMLDRMVKKGLVSARRVGNVYEYSPSVDRTQAARSAWRRFVDTAFSGSMSPALRFLADEAKLTKQQRRQLVRLLEEGNDEDA